jgi:hypothetical protein
MHVYASSICAMKSSCIHTNIYTYIHAQLASKGFKTSIDVHAEDLRDEVVSVMSPLQPQSEKSAHVHANNENREFSTYACYTHCYLVCVLKIVSLKNLCIYVYIHIYIYIYIHIYIYIYIYI